MYNRDTTLWGTHDNKKIAIKDLTDAHVVNILNWIKNHPQAYKEDLYQFFEQEAALRKLWAFAENKPMPTKLPDGRYGFTNISFQRKCVWQAKTLINNAKVHRKLKSLKRNKFNFKD